MIATKPNVRQGATAGLVVSAVLAAAAAGASNAPAETFIETLGVAVAATVGAVALVVAATSRAASTTSGTELAGFWIRAAAFVIDWVPFVLIGLVLAPVGSAAEAILLVLGFAYFVGLWGTTGQTLGMRMVGLRVVRSDGGRIGWSNAIRRFFGLVAAFLCLYVGVIWVAFDPRKRGWADLIGGTLVVRTS
jgi:uncharacterized RDD family membrane protein YckC